jgi:hypothetical protein
VISFFGVRAIDQLAEFGLVDFAQARTKFFSCIEANFRISNRALEMQRSLGSPISGQVIQFLI